MPFQKKDRRITALDVVLLSCLAAGLGWIAYATEAKLDYDWKWEVLPQYLLRFDDASQSWKAGLITQGVLTTIRLSLWATVFAVLIGTVMGIFRTSESLFRRLIGHSYVEMARNLPPLVLVFLFYFFLSDQVMALFEVESWVRSRSEGTQEFLTFLFDAPGRFEAFISAVLTLAIYEGAYIAEIVRAGIESVERGQHEASYALGLSGRQKMRFIILPQAFRRILPPLAGQFISTIKDSAIVSIISIQELTFQGMELMAATYLTFEIWITVMLLYFGMCAIFSLGAAKLEKRLARAGG